MTATAGGGAAVWVRQNSSAPLFIQQVSLTPVQASNFRQGLEALAAQAKVAFVAESVPIRPTFPPDKAPDLKSATPLDEAVTTFAAAYDYDAERQGSVWVLKKRYTNPHDLPAVTLGECTQAMQSMVRILSGSDPKIDSFAQLTLDIARSLTPAQREAMQHDGLRVDSLDPALKTQVRRIALHGFTGSVAEKAGDALFLLKKTSAMMMREKADEGKNVLGYEYSDKRIPGGIVFRPVQETTQLFGGNTLAGSELPKPDLKELARASGKTLGTVIADINARGDGAARFDIDPALAAKPVTVAGAEFASAAQIMTGLATVYGLRVVTEQDGTQRLMGRSYRLPTDLAQVPLYARRILPEPLLRAVHDGALKELEREAKRRNTMPSGDAAVKEWIEWTQQYYPKEQQRLSAFPTVMGIEAARRLRLAVQPRLDKDGPQARIPVATLGEEGRSALALLFVLNVLDRLNTSFQQEPPRFITNFEDLYVVGGPYENDGKPKYAVHLGFLDPKTGAMERVVGIMNVDVPKP